MDPQGALHALLPSGAAVCHTPAGCVPQKAATHSPPSCSDEGQVKKTFRLSPAPSGFYMNLSVTERAASKPTQYATALSPAEARLIRRLMDVSVPRHGAVTCSPKPAYCFRWQCVRAALSRLLRWPWRRRGCNSRRFQ